ncbi:hypothetical protein ACFE04_019382 [Oxalis oulophora]
MPTRGGDKEDDQIMGDRNTTFLRSYDNPSKPFVSSFALLYIFVSFISIAALINVLTGRITLLTDSKRSNSNITHPWVYAAWILLCTIQVTVGLGVEGSIAAGIGGYKFSGNEMSLLSRTICFLGLHETMLFWSRMVVKPVVDDTIFDGCRPERWIDRVAIAASFSGLWWWKLRKEYESLVMVAGAKMEFEFIISWWFYYLIATIGILRIMKSSVWLGKIFLCRRVRRNPETEVLSEVEDKV